MNPSAQCLRAVPHGVSVVISRLFGSFYALAIRRVDVALPIERARAMNARFGRAEWEEMGWQVMLGQRQSDADGFNVICGEDDDDLKHDCGEYVRTRYNVCVILYVSLCARVIANVAR